MPLAGAQVLSMAQHGSKGHVHECVDTACQERVVHSTCLQAVPCRQVPCVCPAGAQPSGPPHLRCRCCSLSLCSCSLAISALTLRMMLPILPLPLRLPALACSTMLAPTSFSLRASLQHSGKQRSSQHSTQQPGPASR